MRSTTVFFVIALVISMTAAAQRIKPRLKDLPLNNLEAFQSPGTNWKIVGAAQSGYNDTSLTTAKGTGVLFNDFNRSIQFKPGHNLMTKMEHGDLILEFDYMITKGSNSGIYLQSRYEVQLFDSWEVKTPRFSDAGGLYQTIKKGNGPTGKAPLKNATFAPGLWQHMEISFQAPRFDASGKKTSPAKFNYVKLNGVTLHENINVNGPTIAAAFEDEKPYGPLMIQGDHGMIAFKNIKYAPQDELGVTVSDLSYRYYENSAKNPEEAIRIKPTSQGKSAAIDARLAPARDKFYIEFEGKITIPKTDIYSFSMLFSGVGSLEIDGKKVIAPAQTSLSAEPLVGTTEIAAGEHRLKLWINKDLAWARTGLSLFIEKPNSRAVALHAPASTPERAPAPLITASAEKGPELIRSFMMQNGKKMTHVVSAGDPSSIHYSYDLLQGGLLKVWKGDFLNTTDMWHERGEPQTASPLGAAIVLSGHCLIYDKSLTKDSIAEYTYKGYKLSSKQLPTFYYEYRQLKIADQIVPLENGRGLSRTISVNGAEKEKQMIRIAQSASITPLGNGLYIIDDHKYYVQLAPGVFPRLETFMGKQVLLLPANETIQYQVIW